MEMLFQDAASKADACSAAVGRRLRYAFLRHTALYTRLFYALRCLRHLVRIFT